VPEQLSGSALSRVLPDEHYFSAIAFLLAAVDDYCFFGIQIRAILSDNGSCYRSRAFRQTCSQLGSQHRFTKSYRLRTKGKAERFIQTLLRVGLSRSLRQLRPQNRPLAGLDFTTTTGAALTLVWTKARALAGSDPIATTS
jgi:transposase InsO family protein